MGAGESRSFFRAAICAMIRDDQCLAEHSEQTNGNATIREFAFAHDSTAIDSRAPDIYDR
jgi:hypothetical protein